MFERFSDELDIAQRNVERETEALINAARIATASTLERNGECHFCGDEVDSDQLFCNSDCAIRFERKKNMQKAAEWV